MITQLNDIANRANIKHSKLTCLIVTYTTLSEVSGPNEYEVYVWVSFSWKKRKGVLDLAYQLTVE